MNQLCDFLAKYKKLREAENVTVIEEFMKPDLLAAKDPFILDPKLEIEIAGFNGDLENVKKFSGEADDFVLCLVCYRGHSKITEYLLSLGKTYDIDRAFIISCSADKLNVVKILQALIQANSTDTYTNGFLCAAMNGHLNVVKYLLGLDKNIDIRAKNDAAFKFACTINPSHPVVIYFIRLAEYLASLCPNYHVVRKGPLSIEWWIDDSAAQSKVGKMAL